MTPEEVREKLGLRTWLENELWVYLNVTPKNVEMFGFEKTAKDLRRQTGRTEKMICEALSAMSNGETVRFVGHSKSSTDYLYQRASKHANTLGITTELLVKKESWPPARLFVDHVARGEL